MREHGSLTDRAARRLLSTRLGRIAVRRAARRDEGVAYWHWTRVFPAMSAAALVALIVSGLWLIAIGVVLLL